MARDTLNRVVKDLAIAGVAAVTLDHLRKTFGTDLHGPGLESGMLGVGRSNEILTLDALRIARTRDWISDDDLAMFLRVYNELTPYQRNKFSSILGKNEQEVSAAPASQAVSDSLSAARTLENHRGAQQVAYLARLPEALLREHLKALNISTQARDHLQSEVAVVRELHASVTGSPGFKKFKQDLAGTLDAINQSLEATADRLEEQNNRHWLRRMLWPW